MNNTRHPVLKSLLISFLVFFLLIASFVIYSRVKNHAIESSFKTSFAAVPVINGCSVDNEMYVSSSMTGPGYYQVYETCKLNLSKDAFISHVESIYADSLGDKQPGDSYYDKGIGYHYSVKGNSVHFNPYQVKPGDNRIRIIIREE